MLPDTEKGPLHSKTLYLHRLENEKSWKINNQPSGYRVYKTEKYPQAPPLLPTHPNIHKIQRGHNLHNSVTPPWIEKHINNHHYPFLAPQNTVPNVYLKPGSNKLLHEDDALHPSIYTPDRGGLSKFLIKANNYRKLKPPAAPNLNCSFSSKPQHLLMTWIT